MDGWRERENAAVGATVEGGGAGYGASPVSMLKESRGYATQVSV